MKARFGIPIVIGALLCTFGCSTVFTAREVQRELETLGCNGDSPVPCARVDFRTYSLAELVSYALTNRPSIVTKMLSVHDARLQLRALAADAPLVSETPWTSPHLSVSGGRAESGAPAKLGRKVWKTDDSVSSGLSLQLLVYDFGRYAAKASAQAEQVLLAELDLADTGYLVFNEVAKAYFDFFEKRAILEVSETNRQQYADQLQQAEERLSAGEANRLDVLKARLDLSKAAQTVVAASNAVATAGAVLMKALGADAARGTYETAFGLASVGTDSVRRCFDRTTYAVDEAYEFALTNAPSMCLARANLRSKSHLVDAAIADLFPTISAAASLNWSDPLWAFSWGFSAAQSIFAGFSKQTAVDRAVVALQQAAVTIEATEQALSVSIETAIANRDNSRTGIESARASVRSARENLATVREQFLVGSASRVELSEAIAAKSKADGDCITAFYDGQRAEAALFALIGLYPVYHEELVQGNE